MGMKGIFGKITSGFRTNFTNLGNIIGNVFVVLSGGLFIALIDAALSNLSFYNNAKVEINNMISKLKTALKRDEGAE